MAAIGDKKEKLLDDSEDESDDELPDYVKDPKLCWICQFKGIKEPGLITMASMPCNCSIYCRKCAMKMATGGKCKKCNQFFVEFRKIK